MTPLVHHRGRTAGLDLDLMSKVNVKALRRPRLRQRDNTDNQSETSSRTSKADEPPYHLRLDLDLPQHRGRRNGSRGGIATAAAVRKRFRSSFAAVANVHVLVLGTLLCLSWLAAPAAGLVIEEPFYGTFDHV